MKILISIILAAIPALLLSQVDTLPGFKSEYLWCHDNEAFMVSSELNAPLGYQSVLAERGMGGPVKQWLWSELGPDVQPEECNPGGKAIPAYANGRGNGTGRINYIYADPGNPDRIFACSPTGGLFVSIDKGDHWKNAGTDQLPISGVSSVVVSQEDPDTWIIATGDGDDRFMFSDGIWRTVDAGNTWENINGSTKGKRIAPDENPSNYLYVAKIAVHPCHFGRVFAATNQGLYVTNNALDEADKVLWKRVGESFFYDVLVPDPDRPIVLASGEDFFRSDDCGNSWKEAGYPDYQDQDRFGFSRISMSMTPGDNRVYLGLSCAERFSQSALGEGELWTYSLDSEQFEFVRSLRDEMNNLITTRGRAMAVSPIDNQLLLVGNVQPVFRSTDGGQNFSRIGKNQMHDDIHTFAWSSDGEVVFVGHDGGVSRSFDQGLTWENADRGIGVANVFGLSVAQIEQHQVAFGAYDTGGNVLVDGSWHHTSWGDGFETIIDYSNPDVIYTTKQHGHIQRSDDRGGSFENTLTSSKTKTDWHTWIRQHPQLPNVIFCSGDRLLRSYDKGNNWDVILDVNGLEGEYLNVFRLFTSEVHPDVLYAYVLDETKVDPILLMTRNSSEPDAAKVIWEEVAKLPKKGWVTSLVVDPDDPAQFWMTYKSAEPSEKVFRYNGERYVDVTSNLGWCIIGELVIDKNSNERLYLGTNHGVFTRDKSEEQWTLLEGLPGTWVRALEINYRTNMIYAATFGRGIWFAPLYQD